MPQARHNPFAEIDKWMARRRAELGSRPSSQSARLERAQYVPPGREIAFNPFRPPGMNHLTRKRGQSDSIAYISAKELRAIDDQMPEECALAMAERLNEALPRHGVTSPTQVAAFVAQALTESERFRDFEEDLYYQTPGLLRRRFPSRFPTVDSEAPYRRNEEGLANYVYATRNGNHQPGDGYRYRGRGPIQVTGRDNYRVAGYEDNPEALDDLATGFDGSSRWWSAQGLPQRTSTWLDRDGFDSVTRTVNGAGMTEADARWRDYLRARAAMTWRMPRQPDQR